MFSVVESEDGVTFKCPCGFTETAADETFLKGFERGRGLDGSTNMAYICAWCGHTDQATRMTADP